MALLFGVLGVTAPARAGAEFSLSAGYAHIELDGSASPFDDRGGFRVEPRFTFWGENLPQLKLGVGVGFSGYSKSIDDDDDFVVIDGEVFFIESDDVEALSLITPEFQISWRQPLGGDGRWYVEPGVGVGAVIGNYWVGDWWDEDIDEWDATVSGRPFIRAGYQAKRWMAGLEVSYLFGGSLDFTDEVGGDITEFYAGGFFGWRW
jgi:hypothetical protein